MDSIPQKQCSVCKKYFDATTEYFHKKKRGKYGVCSWCRKCHSEKCKPHALIWTKMNPEKHAASRKNWTKNHPENVVVSSQNLIAKKRLLPCELTPQEWLINLDHWSGNCAYCGTSRSTRFNIEMDHFIPLVNDKCPGTVKWNVVPSCKSCNRSKSNSNAREWLIRKFGAIEGDKKYESIQIYLESIKPTSADLRVK